MKPVPTRHAMTAMPSFSAGDRVCTESFAAATVLAFNAETGEVTVRRSRDNGEEIAQAQFLIRIAGKVGDQVPA